MIRPLPPFTVRPLKQRKLRKTLQTGAILTLARDLPASAVKAERRPMKAEAGRAAPRLKVLGRES